MIAIRSLGDFLLAVVAFGLGSFLAVVVEGMVGFRGRNVGKAVKHLQRCVDRMNADALAKNPTAAIVTRVVVGIQPRASHEERWMPSIRPED